jgi:hypothetical protein
MFDPSLHITLLMELSIQSDRISEATYTYDPIKFSYMLHKLAQNSNYLLEVLLVNHIKHM